LLRDRLGAAGPFRDVMGEASAIREAIPDDAEVLCDIYNHYVRRTIVSFEEQPIAPFELARRMESVRPLGLPWLVLQPPAPLPRAGPRGGGGVDGVPLRRRWEAAPRPPPFGGDPRLSPAGRRRPGPRKDSVCGPARRAATASRARRHRRDCPAEPRQRPAARA